MPLFPPIEPYDTGMLDVGDGQSVYWECCGNPDGQPALYCHGGPGSGSTSGARRYFDPARFRVLLFDQRGCGRSRPSAADPRGDLGGNTTHHLIADIEELRERHDVERWTVLGVSWGSTLALAYAESCPGRVAGLVLAAVTTTSAREVRWVTEDVGRIFPEAWARFAGAVPERLRDQRLVDAYATLLADPEPAVRRTRLGSGASGRRHTSTAWRLHRRWRSSELRVVEDAGHGGAGSFADAVAESLISVADRMRPGPP